MKSTVTAIAVLLAGCQTIISPEYYRASPTEEICRQIWSSPSYSVNNVARNAELERRGTSCGDPPPPTPPVPPKPAQ
jgi:hypothetical protein